MNTFDKDNNPQSPTEAIQDYLDLLLTPTREVHNQLNDVDTALIKEAYSLGDVESKVAAQVNTVHSQIGEQSLLERRRQHNERSSPLLNTIKAKPEPPQQAVAFERTRPYADPVKPLTLRIPLPSVASKAKQPVPKPALATAVLTEKSLPVTKQAPEPSQKVILPDTKVNVAPAVEIVQQETHQSVQSMAVSDGLRPDSGPPVWAQQRFQCLLFSVGGLTLAVPLVELGSIYPLNKPLTHLFGQIDWFMGLLTVKEQRIRTVNTAKVVMPERYQEAMAANFHYVITINNVDWGLAVDNVATAITLEPGDVNWRTKRGKRPWLAGTVVEHMCALLDVSQLAAMFTEYDKAR